MAQSKRFLAFDLGAESGRAVVGLLAGDRLRLEEVHRFPNGPVRILDSLHWDVLRLWGGMKHGLRMYLQRFGPDLTSIGVDTWGVDFALLDRDDQLVGNPYHYRDSRTDGMMEEAFRRVPRREIFERTGIQFMQINTLYQLLAMAQSNSAQLESAEGLLMMPDLFNFWLTGRRACEFTEATTSQFYDPRADDWARGMLERLSIPTRILGEIVPPGTVLGPLLPSVADEVGLREVSVIAPACHDTGSAVAAVPAQGSDWAYLSSGTWSLMGVEVDEPVITPQSLEYNFTNEGGVRDTFRLLKNIMGLWLVQECRRAWAREGESYSYDELTQMAEQAEPFVALVDPDDPAFLHPMDMPAEIQASCARTGQPAPEDRGAIVRCALESLALTYRATLEKLEAMLNRRLEVIRIVGGGSQNQLLCQFTADATQRQVLAGPVEATAIGNVLMQALTLGEFSSLEEARGVVRRSFKMTRYEPGDPAPWEAAYERFCDLVVRTG
ncbi:MAG: rhamnulokinase family protein [Chloroflexota bacterium]|nr:rhamnulokinase family protein [Chloroflexota bacterium]